MWRNSLRTLPEVTFKIKKKKNWLELNNVYKSGIILQLGGKKRENENILLRIPCFKKKKKPRNLEKIFLILFFFSFLETGFSFGQVCPSYFYSFDSFGGTCELISWCYLRQRPQGMC